MSIISKINKQLTSHGLRMYRSPAGYYYIMSIEDNDFPNDIKSIYIYRADDLPFERWQKIIDDAVDHYESWKREHNLMETTKNLMHIRELRLNIHQTLLYEALKDGPFNLAPGDDVEIDVDPNDKSGKNRKKAKVVQKSGKKAYDKKSNSYLLQFDNGNEQYIPADPEKVKWGTQRENKSKYYEYKYQKDKDGTYSVWLVSLLTGDKKDCVESGMRTSRDAERKCVILNSKITESVEDDDLESFKKSTPQGKSNLELLRHSVEKHQAINLKFEDGTDMLVDMQTANVLMRIYDACSDKSKGIFERKINTSVSEFKQVVNICWKYVK